MLLDRGNTKRDSLEIWRAPKSLRWSSIRFPIDEFDSVLSLLSVTSGAILIFVVSRDFLFRRSLFSTSDLSTIVAECGGVGGSCFIVIVEAAAGFVCAGDLAWGFLKIVVSL